MQFESVSVPGETCEDEREKKPLGERRIRNPREKKKGRERREGEGVSEVVRNF